jgi:hypothetical protein
LFTVISCDVDDNGVEEEEVEEFAAPRPAPDLLAEPVAPVLAPMSSSPPSPAPVTAPLLSPEEILWARYRKTWGPKFHPKNILKTGVKGSTTDEREDFQTVLKGIAKKHLDRNDVVTHARIPRTTIDRSLSFYLSVPFSLSLSLSHSLSTVFVHHIVLDAWLFDNSLGKSFVHSSSSLL